eukprot:211418-Ditylum_brightwellii.AAC.1
MDAITVVAPITIFCNYSLLSKAYSRKKKLHRVFYENILQGTFYASPHRFCHTGQIYMQKSCLGTAGCPNF